MCEFIGTHNHLDYSNLRLLDCTNSVEDLIQTAADLNYKGIAITDHETVSGHVQAIKVTRELKEKKKIPKDFKLILGNELYLVDDVNEVRENYQSKVTKFPHFLILSKNFKGHEQLRYLSSQAWENSFYTGTMLRVPTSKKLLEEVVKENPNNLIATTACLGSEACIHILAIKDAIDNDDKQKVGYHTQKLHEFLVWCITLFGKENFFIELQPAYSPEQIYCNGELLKLAEQYELKHIISTDTHYLRPEDRVVHKAFLNAKDGDREVDDFYEATFLQTSDEIYERLSYLDKRIIDEAFKNTMLIGSMVEDYTIEHETIIPKIKPPKFELNHFFKSTYSKYEYINKMAHSDDEQDRYIMKLIEDGFKKYIPYNTLTKEELFTYVKRLDVELGELWEITQQLNQTMTSYYITTAKVVDIIWQDDECGGNSLVGSGRGSSGGFLICFLLGITQIDPLAYGIEMPHWRHIHRSRPDIGALDIDIDTEGSKRPRIIQALRKYFGEDKILQVCTFGTEGSKSAIQTACRGLNIDSDIGLYISSLIPFERGENWSISDCLFGNEDKGREPVSNFINEIDKYENLKETALKIEGKINKRSIHAGGVIIFNEPFYKSNAMMKAPNGVPITQFNLDDSQAVGNIKFDLLTIEALDKIRTEIDLLLEYKEIKWQETLRKTFEAYLHPNVIDKESPEIYQMLGDGSVPDLFQFSTEIGLQSAMKVKPKNLLEVASANSLMRLMSEGEGEQPIDTFVRFKNDLKQWYDEMKSFGLSDDEIKILEEYMLKLNGVADTQEVVMLLTMDERIAGFSVLDANKLRKTIAKKQAREEFDKRKEEFYKKGKEKGTSLNQLNYVWKQVERQRGYAFSVLHTLAYSIIALQELTLNHRYNKIYWNTAVLSVNAASNDEGEEGEDSKNKSTNYGKVASAIGNMKQHGVVIGLPDINNAHFGFKPDIRNNQIIFGLKGLNGIGDEVVQHIIANRPYHSFEDFYERMHVTGIVKKSQVVQLIKAGCFESFGDRAATMKTFVTKVCQPKERLTMQNFNAILENELLPDTYRFYEHLFNYRKIVMKQTFNMKEIEGDYNPKDKYYLLNSKTLDFFYEHFSNDTIYTYHNNYPVISEKIFKKEYDKKMNDIKEWLTSEKTLDAFNSVLFLNEWNTLASGNISKWEMDSLSFYYSEHELKDVNLQKYQISNFNELPEAPEHSGYFKWKDRETPKFKIDCIIGTVLDKNKNKHTVTLLTTSGVITVKYQDGQFAFYNKQISRNKADGKKETLEKSWFTRGNKIVVVGYRRGAQFRAKRYKDTKYQHTTMLIQEVLENGNLVVLTDRKKAY